MNMETKITMGSVQEPILKALLTRGGQAPAAQVVEDVLTTLGGKTEGEEGKKHKMAVTNGAYELRQRCCITSNGKIWELTGLGKTVAAGEIEIPARDYKAEMIRVRAPRGSKILASSPPRAPSVDVHATDRAPSDNTDKGTGGAVLGDSPKEDPEPVSAQVSESTVSEPGIIPPFDPVTIPVIVEQPLAATPPVAQMDSAESTAQIVIPIRRMKVAFSQPLPQWSEDKNLRQLVAANTECFGSWSPKASVCGTCQLNQDCRKAQASTLTLLASRIKNETDVDDKVKNLHTVVGFSLAEGRTREEAVLPEGRPLKATFAATCFKTGVTINPGDSCFYVHGQGITLEA